MKFLVYAISGFCVYFAGCSDDRVTPVADPPLAAPVPARTPDVPSGDRLAPIVPVAPPTPPEKGKTRHTLVVDDVGNGAFRGDLNAANYDHIVIVPDVHGDKVAFTRTLLLALRLIDGSSAYDMTEGGLMAIFDQAIRGSPPSTPVSTNRRVALVQLGDLMDRGPYSLECVRIMKNIESVFGWKSLALFGNHEIMNFAGTAGGYVNEEDLGGFTTIEERLEAVQPGGAAFNEIAENLLAMVRLAGPDPLANTLFIHGGVTIDWLYHVGLWTREDANLRGSALVERVNRYFAERLLTSDTVRDLDRDPQSPVWTRYMAGQPALTFIGCESVQQLLDRFEVSRIILGHTPQVDHVAKSRCGGKIILADVAMSEWIGDERKFPSAMMMSLNSEHAFTSLIPYSIGDAPGYHNYAWYIAPLQPSQGA